MPKDDWNRAHESAQRDEGTEGSWVHAYLHRKEGDQGNAVYWYSRAGKPVCREQLDAELRLRKTKAMPKPSRASVCSGSFPISQR